MPFVKGQKPTQGFFLIFRFISKYPDIFVPRQNHHHVSISEHAARKASGKGRARRSESMNRGVERYNRLYFEPCSPSSLTDPLECCGTDQGIEPRNANNTHLLSASTLGPWCASYCSIRERTFGGLRSLCRGCKEDFCGETVGRFHAVLQLSWFAAEIQAARMPRMLTTQTRTRPCFSVARCLGHCACLFSR